MLTNCFLFQVCHHKSLLHCFCHDLLLCIRCSCLLANTSLLLDCALCPDNEATDCTYDQVQVCPVQHWKAGETSMFLSCRVSFYCWKVTLCSRVSQKLITNVSCHVVSTANCVYCLGLVNNNWFKILHC